MDGVWNGRYRRSRYRGPSVGIDIVAKKEVVAGNLRRDRHKGHGPVKKRGQRGGVCMPMIIAKGVEGGSHCAGGP